MHSRNHNRTIRGTVGTVEMRRLMPPRPVKALPEHTSFSNGSREARRAAEDKTLPLALPFLAGVDRHTHSLGYGIDE